MRREEKMLAIRTRFSFFPHKSMTSLIFSSMHVDVCVDREEKCNESRFVDKLAVFFIGFHGTRLN